MGLSVQRHSPHHVTAQLTVAGRGLYFSRTPDGNWWALRLRRHRVRCSWPDAGEPPPDIGVREPRRPRPNRDAGGATPGGQQA
jgi:hypothetical protein